MRRTLLILLTTLLALLLALELLMRLLPVSGATRVADHLGAEIPAKPPGHRWTIATGWDLRNAQTLQANAQGFSAQRDFVRDPRAVALIGDSFVEASMLPAPERLEAQLQRHLGEAQPVYAMGSPGSSLLDYGWRARWAREQFGVQRAVLLLETGDIRQSFCGSGNVVSRCLTPEGDLRGVPRAEAGALKRLLRHSALVHYLLAQLRLDADTLWANAVAQSLPAQGHEVGQGAAVDRRAGSARSDTLDEAERRRIEQVTDAFFALYAADPAQLVILLDAHRGEQRRTGQGSSPAREHFMALVRARGVRVVDLAAVYAPHLASSPLRLEVSPSDGHLNGLGLGLVAQAAARALSAPQ